MNHFYIVIFIAGLLLFLCLIIYPIKFSDDVSFFIFCFLFYLMKSISYSIEHYCQSLHFMCVVREAG